MFGRNKASKRDTRVAELLEVVQAQQPPQSPQQFGPQGISYGAEGDPPSGGFGMGGQTNIQVVGNASPEQIAAALAKAQEVLGHLGQRGGFPVRGAALANPDTVAQLQHLASLHAQGALTNEEFAAQTRQLIDGQ